MAVKKTLTDLFEEHLGAHEYDDYVTKIIKWYYNGGFAKVAWCAISMSYMANQLGILDQFGGKNQNVYEMLVAVKAAVKKSGKGQVWMRDELTKGMQIRRGDVVFILKSDPPMNAGSSKHVTTVYEGFQWKGTSTFKTLGGNQSDYIQVKGYPQSQVYAIFRPDYANEKPKLKKGDKGAAVRELQIDLNLFGFRDKNGDALKVDGSFGAKTLYALKEMQQDQGLKVDGICGPLTWAKLDEMVAHIKIVRLKGNVYMFKTPEGTRLRVIFRGTETQMSRTVKKDDEWSYLPDYKSWIRTKYLEII